MAFGDPTSAAPAATRAGMLSATIGPREDPVGIEVKLRQEDGTADVEPRVSRGTVVLCGIGTRSCRRWASSAENRRYAELLVVSSLKQPPMSPALPPGSAGRRAERCDDLRRLLAHIPKDVRQLGVEVIAVAGVQGEPLVSDLDLKRTGQDDDALLALVAGGFECAHVVTGESRR